ncbi:unnamed protein product [Xylocopa violacea]|uniref:Uncharacterized protein n=1 Tax=Xylocopa violacea TaxID=135666 RepID=A0ABP1P9E1_XYLVO
MNNTSLLLINDLYRCWPFFTTVTLVDLFNLSFAWTHNEWKRHQEYKRYDISEYGFNFLATNETIVWQNELFDEKLGQRFNEQYNICRITTKGSNDD